MAIVRHGPTKCAHEPGCPHDIGPAAAGFAPGINAGAVPELRTGAAARGSGPVERLIDPMRRDGRGDEPHVLHHRGFRAAQEDKVTENAIETAPAWPTGDSAEDKRTRASLLDWAMRRFEASEDPQGEACRYLGIKRNAASMILRTQRLKAESATGPAEAAAEIFDKAVQKAFEGSGVEVRSSFTPSDPEPFADANDADFGEGAPNAQDRADAVLELELDGEYDESADDFPQRLPYAGDLEPNVFPVPELSPTGWPILDHEARREPDPLVEAYRVVRELAPGHTLSSELLKAIAVRIADKAADAA